MKSTTAALVVVIGVLLHISPLRAQEESTNHFGIGISIEPALFGQTSFVLTGDGFTYSISSVLYSTSPYYFYLPINVTKRLRVEPRFGIYSLHNQFTDAGFSGIATTNDLTLVQVGLAVSYLIPLNERFQLNIGPRVGWNHVSSSSTGYQVATPPIKVTEIESETDYVFSGTFGAEYFPLSEFSVGGEVDLNYVTFGNPDDSLSSGTSLTRAGGTRTQSLVATGALFFVRWYFL